MQPAQSAFIGSKTKQTTETTLLTDSESSGRSSPSTTAGSILASLERPPSPDPLRRPMRNSLSNIMDSQPTETAGLRVRLRSDENRIARRIDIRPQLEEIASLTARLCTSKLGWLDNAARRESNQNEAIRNGSMEFETVEKFLSRVGPPDLDNFVECSDEEEDDDFDLESEDGSLPNDNSSEPEIDQQRIPRVQTPGSDNDSDFAMNSPPSALQTTAAPAGRPEPIPAKPNFAEKRRNKQLMKGLNMVQDGAQICLQPPDVSTKHAIPQDCTVDEIEEQGDGFRLRPHQRDGVGRMIDLEETRQAWVLADDPGLGKTVQVIAVIKLDKKKFPSGVTLGIVPKTLLDYWRLEFEKHTPSLKVLKFHADAGIAVKNSKPADLLKYDVILTTYETLVSQWTPFATAKEDWPLLRIGKVSKDVKIKPSNRRAALQNEGKPKTVPRALVKTRANASLYSIKFRRVFLDEGHRIKNADTQTSRSVADIDATYRGCVTGTLMQNDYGDFFAIARFLHISPWNNRELFKACFIKKAAKDAVLRSGAAELDKNMEIALGCIRSCVTIRRLKGQLFDGKAITGVEAPVEREVEVILGPVNQKYQDKFKDMWDYNYRVLLKGNDKTKSKPGIPKRPDMLADLTNGQLEAIHPILPTASYGDLGKVHADSAEVDGDIDEDENSRRVAIPERGELLERFKNASETEQMKSGKKRRQEFKDSLRAQPGIEESECIDKVVGLIEELIEEEKKRLLAFKDSPPSEQKRQAAHGKIILFSNFLSASDLVAVALERRNIEFYEINGHSTDQERDDVLRKFEENDSSGRPKDFSQGHVKPSSIRVLLASTRVAAEGFNLVHACHVILLGPGWNPFVSVQAISRTHRIGQIRRVVVYFVWTEYSMHLRVLRVQAVKRRKVKGVMEDHRIRVAAHDVMKWDLSTFKGYMADKNVLTEFEGEETDSEDEDEDEDEEVEGGGADLDVKQEQTEEE